MFKKDSDTQNKKNNVNNINNINIFTVTDENGELPENSARRYFSVLGIALLASFIIKDILQAALALLSKAYAPELLENDLFVFLLTNIPLYAVALPLCALFLRRLPKATPLKNDIKAHHWLGGMCITFFFMLVGNYVSQILTTALSLLRGRSLTNPLDNFTQSTSPIFILISAVIIAPIAEELVFRKLLCDKLLPLGEGYAIFVSSAIFALAHGNLFQIFYAFSLGCFFSYVYVNTGKIKHTILYHMVVNFIGMIVSSWILSRLDLEALMTSVTVSMILDNLIPLLALIAYEFVILGSALVGIILIVANYKKIKIRGGLIPPQYNARISCVFMNFGIASLLLYLAMSIISSLF